MTDLAQLSKLVESDVKEENNPTKTEQKKKPEQRLVGIVKFYDDDKGFGYLVTNNKGINKTRGIESEIKEIFVHSSGFIGATKSYESSMKAVKIALAEKEDDEKNEEKV